MDLKLSSHERSTSAEIDGRSSRVTGRVAVDALLGSAPAAAQGGAATPPTTARPRRRDLARAAAPPAARAARRSTTASAGSAGARSTSSPERTRRRARRDLRRGHVLRVVLQTSAPPRQVHVCVDLACRIAGGLAARTISRRARTRRRASGACERAPAALADRGRADPQRRALFAPATPVACVRSHRRRRVARRSRHRSIAAVPQCRRRPTGRIVLLRRVGRGRPDEPRRLPIDGRLRGACDERSRIGPAGSSARSPTPGSSDAAARRSPPGASGKPSLASRPARTISSATPTRASPARSRTAS